uniref:NADH dehydrogenase subunit 3 n=1 Tax=Halticus minutus TaxID=2917254 RepID=UPI001F140D24|nr:NADH dehydrogenase subunit 3 [Halticus minutus]UKT60747.1 NADH dehydrogenase subunit 3 [Halticus minutus]
MFKMTMLTMLFIMISVILLIICLMISKKSFMDREKMSPFECGFDPNSNPRTPFSSQFFLIAVLFLIFDIEIMIIVPMIITMKTAVMKMWIMTSSLFIIILIMGLYHEWYNGVLEWTN